MAEDLNLKPAKAMDPFTGRRAAGTGRKPPGEANEDTFSSDFAKLKLAVIRPAFEKIGDLMKARGHEVSISEDPGGKISIHIVPAGVNKSIHPYDWFPTLSFFGAPFTKTLGLHGRNARRNSDGGSGQRGEYKLAQVSTDVVEKEVMKFIGEIANW